MGNGTRWKTVIFTADIFAVRSNLRWRFRKILWPSQNIWTLTNYFSFWGLFSSPSVKRPYFARPCTRLFSIETGLCSCPSPYVCISRTSHMQHDATHKESNQNEPIFFLFLVVSFIGIFPYFEMVLTSTLNLQQKKR